MTSFPGLNFNPDDIKIRYLEPFASQALDKRFLGSPVGIYEGFTPSFVGAVVSLMTSSRGFSLARVFTPSGPVCLDLAITRDLTLDFTGHDFAASGDIYVVVKVVYNLGSTTTSAITTQTPAPIGSTEIGICRVVGVGVGGITSVEFAAPPDQHTPLATAFNPFGYMGSGSVEALATAVSAIGKLPFNALVKTSGLTLTAGDIDQVHMLDMSAIIANQTIQMPPSASLVDGCRVAFLSLTGLPLTFTVDMQAGPGDAIMSLGIPVSNPTLIPSLRIDVGHYWIFTLVKTGFGTPRWYRNYETLPQLHGSFHTKGEHDEIRLDDLNDPEDNTDLDATIGRHGLLPKLSNNVTEFLNGLGGFAVPGGAVSGGNSYIFNTPSLNTNNHSLVADGKVYILNPPGGTGVTTYNLPDGITTPLGSIVRCYFFATAPASPNHVRFASLSGVFLWNGGQVLGTVPPQTGLISDWKKGQFLEFTLDNDTGGNFWVCTANTQIDEHRTRHAVTGQDPLDITTLAGFPGGSTTFLREDGTFTTPIAPHFAANASGTLTSQKTISVSIVGTPPVTGEIMTNTSVAGTGTVINYYPAQGIITYTPTGGSFNVGNALSFSVGLATGSCLNSQQSFLGSVVVFAAQVDASSGISVGSTDGAIALDSAGVYVIQYSAQATLSSVSIQLYYDMLDLSVTKGKTNNSGVTAFASGMSVNAIVTVAGPALIFMGYTLASGTFEAATRTQISVHKIG